MLIYDGKPNRFARTQRAGVLAADTRFILPATHSVVVRKLWAGEGNFVIALWRYLSELCF